MKEKVPDEVIKSIEYDKNKINKKMKEGAFLFPYLTSKHGFDVPKEIKTTNKPLFNYFERTIMNINNSVINKKDEPTSFKIQRILFYIFGTFFFIFTLYIGIIICSLCLFNPMIILCFLFFVITGEIELLCKIYFSIKNSSRIARINNQINYENENQENKEQFKWKLGKDASWVEVKVYRVKVNNDRKISD